MLLYIFLNVLVYLAMSTAKDVFGKPFKTIPTVSNSLVNLGKMDISFYFNAKPQAYMPRLDTSESNSQQSAKICPCSGFNPPGSPSKHPFDFLDKILSGHNFFKEPSSSALCCDSHEQIHEDIIFEFTPRQTQMAINPMNSNIPIPSSIFNYLQKPPALPMTSKNKAIEIFLFPKKKENIPMNFENLFPKKKEIKSIIKVVGDRELKNEFKTENFAPPLPVVKNELKEEKPKQGTKVLDEAKDMEKGNTL